MVSERRRVAYANKEAIASHQLAVSANAGMLNSPNFVPAASNAARVMHAMTTAVDLALIVEYPGLKQSKPGWVIETKGFIGPESIKNVVFRRCNQTWGSTRQENSILD